MTILCIKLNYFSLFSIEGDDSIYISKVAEAGPAHRDGKILIGDRLVQVISFVFGFFVRKYLLNIEIILHAYIH